MRSVRRTLVVTLLAAVASVTVVVAFLVYRLARNEIDAIFDYNLRQIALTLRDRVPSGDAQLVGPGGYDFVIQIWTRDGLRLYLSRPDSDLPAIAELGYSTVRTGTGSWRVYSAELSDLVVQVAQPLSVRRELAFAAAMRTLAPVLFVLPVLALLVWVIVARALAPFDRLAGTVGSLGPAALDPIPEAGVPEEALPLVRSINGLLVRLASALAAQRAFVADAAHELRTPLAALKLQMHLVERAGDGADRAEALAALDAGLKRTTHIVQQLLALARAEPEAPSAIALEPVRLSELVAEAVAGHALLAEAKRIDLGVAESSSDAVVLGEPASLRTLLANLVDNAVRYTPEGGRVDVSAGRAGGRPFLQVADTGPGIPGEERERVFDRFYRRAGRESGSGLGLAIVRAIAKRHGARVVLGDTPGGGLTARVEFEDRAAAAVPGRPPLGLDRDGRP